MDFSLSSTRNGPSTKRVKIEGESYRLVEEARDMDFKCDVRSKGLFVKNDSNESLSAVCSSLHITVTVSPIILLSGTVGQTKNLYVNILKQVAPELWSSGPLSNMPMPSRLRCYDSKLTARNNSGPVVVWLTNWPVDRRVAGSIPETTDFLTECSGQALVSLFTKQCKLEPVSKRAGVRHCEHWCHAVSLRRASRGQNGACNPDISLEKSINLFSVLCSPWSCVLYGSCWK